MRSRRLAALASAALCSALLGVLGGAAPALAGDPIMPLSEVRQGMQCTGYSVIRGTEVTSFDVEILDVVGGDEGSRLLVRESGDAVDETGVGAGFSGSPIYCPAAGGPRVIGAISESIGEYGGKVVLATPIQAMLGVPVDPPKARATRASRRLAARARPLAVPLTVSGLSPRLGRALQEAAAKRGRVVLAAPQAGPLGSFPVQTLRPGSALGVGYADGDINASAIGTVTYVDGDRI